MSVKWVCVLIQKNLNIKIKDIVKRQELNDRIQTLAMKSYLQGTKSTSKQTSDDGTAAKSVENYFSSAFAIRNVFSCKNSNIEVVS